MSGNSKTWCMHAFPEEGVRGSRQVFHSIRRPAAAFKGEFSTFGTKDIRTGNASGGVGGRRGKGRGQKRPNDGWSRKESRKVGRWKRRKRITKWTTRSPPSVPGGRTARKVMVSGVRAVSDAARVWQRARTYRALPS